MSITSFQAPTDIVLSNHAVTENSVYGTVVGVLAGLDPDAGDTLSFSLLDDAQGRFAIKGNQLVVTGPLDYEAAAIHHIQVRVTDASGLTYTEAFEINVLDVDEAPTSHAPTDLVLSNSTIAENSALGAVVGLLHAVDPDAGEAFTYELVDDAQGRFRIVGDQLVVSQVRSTMRRPPRTL